MAVQRRRSVSADSDASPPPALEANAADTAPPHEDFVRSEVMRMLDSDWTNAELQSVGVTPALAEKLGIRHPRFGHFTG